MLIGEISFLICSSKYLQVMYIYLFFAVLRAPILTSFFIIVSSLSIYSVAAAYNLGAMLISSMNSHDWPRGIVYFIGIFGPLYNMWEDDLFYSSRYTVVDHCHRLGDVIRFFFVAVTVLHIKPLEYLSDESSVEAFCITLSMFLDKVMHLIMNVELYLYAHGDRTAIQNHTKRKIFHQLLPTNLIYLVATIVAGYLHFGTTASSDNDNDDSKYYDNKYNNATEYDNTQDGNHGDHRFLGPAADDPSSGYGYHDKEGTNWKWADLPLALCCLGYLLNILYTVYRKLRIGSGKKGDIRDHYVPNNVDYMIHRYGEWVMYVYYVYIGSVLDTLWLALTHYFFCCVLRLPRE
jgi:hypothetical protein